MYIYLSIYLVPQSLVGIQIKKYSLYIMAFNSLCYWIILLDWFESDFNALPGSLIYFNLHQWTICCSKPKKYFPLK